MPDSSVNPGDVDEHGRLREPDLHHRQQRVAARQQLGVLAVLGQQRDRVRGGVGDLVVERRGDHAVTSAAGRRRRRRTMRSGKLVGRGEHRADDVVVAGAAAEVAFKALPHLLLGRVRVLRQQAGRCHHHAGRAEAALQAVVLAERLLDDAHRAVVGDEALGGGHRAAVGLDGEHRAGLDRLAVEQHRAGTAGRGVAADVRGAQVEGLPQVVDEQQPRLDLVAAGDSVDRELDLHDWIRPPSNRWRPSLGRR